MKLLELELKQALPCLLMNNSNEDELLDTVGNEAKFQESEELEGESVNILSLVGFRNSKILLVLSDPALDDELR